MWWPGAVYDGESARKMYIGQLKKTAKELGINLDIRKNPIYSIEEADAWLAGAKSSRSDGLMVMMLDRQQHSWPTAGERCNARLVSERDCPDPLGIRLVWHPAGIHKCRLDRVVLRIQDLHLERDALGEGEGDALVGSRLRALDDLAQRLDSCRLQMEGVGTDG